MDASRINAAHFTGHTRNVAKITVQLRSGVALLGRDIDWVTEVEEKPTEARVTECSLYTG